MGLVKNENHFLLCIEKIFSNISNCSQLETNILFYDEIANQIERT